MRDLVNVLVSAFGAGYVGNLGHVAFGCLAYGGRVTIVGLASEGIFSPAQVLMVLLLGVVDATQQTLIPLSLEMQIVLYKL